MTEPVWYYARGEVERGPFTSLQIKALASAGKLRRNDLVWKEGMENWTSAEQVDELFPGTLDGDTPAVDSPTPFRPRGTYPEPSPLISDDLSRLLTTCAWGCLMVGMGCVVIARGCESLGDRKVSRLDAAAKLQAVEEWQRQRTPIASELDTLHSKEKLAPAEQERARELTQSLNQLDSSRSAEELSAAQRLGVNRAAAETRAGAFHRGLAFHGGVVFLVIGGFALAILGSGSDRWLGVGLLLAIGYSALTAAN
jgi:hypothetical protein